ncbi:MAG TPA: hypothetical protein VJ890_14570 [Vineibacter sp.]|nr:hypothetical protein [Vineibacter sp.]
MRLVLIIAALLLPAACVVEGTYSSDGLASSGRPCKVTLSGFEMVADVKLTCRGGEVSPFASTP